MITDVVFRIYPNNPELSLEAGHVSTNGGRLQQVLAHTYPHDLREWTEYELTHLRDAIIREGESRACVVAFPGEVRREQSEELGPLDFAGDEHEEVLGMQMSDAKEQKQKFMDQLKLDIMDGMSQKDNCTSDETLDKIV